ncbi:MAG: V-type ATP synthase subunit I, partial [Clostridium sp.]
WDIPEDEEAPVLLSNGTFAASAEGVTASFGLPARGELDPTPIMSACYVFFFGLMLSDAAYGLIIFLACAFALKRFPRMEKNLQKAVRLFMYSGISTLFWGVMFGGYFGDAVDIISKTWFGRQITIPALWFAPLNNPMRLLIFSLLFGVIHLFLGLGIKGYMLLKDGKVMDFFCEVVLWYMMLIGLILMLIPSSLFAPMIQMQIVFPPVINAMAKWSAILGAVGIVLLSARDKKNPVLRLALGAYDLYNITGWLSDALSYSRLLALGLATGVIASVINQMGSMVGTGIFGTLAFIVIFCFGHLFNLAINLLGAYVHTCRLQYVEFFGKFYEGGGRPFEPFRRNTKYVEIKEDE